MTWSDSSWRFACGDVLNIKTALDWKWQLLFIYILVKDDQWFDDSRDFLHKLFLIGSNKNLLPPHQSEEFSGFWLRKCRKMCLMVLFSCTKQRCLAQGIVAHFDPPIKDISTIWFLLPHGLKPTSTDCLVQHSGKWAQDCFILFSAAQLQGH